MGAAHSEHASDSDDSDNISMPSLESDTDSDNDLPALVAVPADHFPPYGPVARIRRAAEPSGPEGSYPYMSMVPSGSENPYTLYGFWDPSFLSMVPTGLFMYADGTSRPSDLYHANVCYAPLIKLEEVD